MDKIECSSCGALLVKRLTDRGVTPADSDTEIPFRRTTDYIMCTSCMTLFSVRDLARQAGIDDGDDDGPRQAHDAQRDDGEEQAADADVITLLERMAQRKRSAS